LTFDIIDTARLLDYTGILNVLPACAFLLKPTFSSTLRTELIVSGGLDVATAVRAYMCGDVPTVALILGLQPMQYWSNASATWDPKISVQQSSDAEGCENESQYRPVILWKPANTSPVRYAAHDLASFVFSMYIEMFKHEDWTRRFEELPKTSQLPEAYTYASFAVMMKNITSSRMVNWNHFVEKLLDRIMAESRLLVEYGMSNIDPSHFQSLLVHLDALSLMDRNKIYDAEVANGQLGHQNSLFGDWENIPTHVCVTLSIPRDALHNFEVATELYLCEVQLQSSPADTPTSFPDLQMGFGKATTCVSTSTGEYTISICTDDRGWAGDSTIVVSAMVPTLVLDDNFQDSGTIGLYLHHPLGAAGSARENHRCLHSAACGDEGVFITRHRPNMDGYISVPANLATSTNYGKL
jgi:hypothetical protein